MPAKRPLEKADDISIPDITDAGERKRVLNVLAQRRYREISPSFIPSIFQLTLK
jgi:hypothetical protein